MRAVVQVVTSASVSVDGVVVGRIEGPGLVVLVGVTHTDGVGEASRLAAKVWELRVFRDETSTERRSDERGTSEKPSATMSADDRGAPILVVSQFTLYADTRKGRSPSWSAAAPGPVAEPLVDAFVSGLQERGAVVETGVFGAMMQVSLVNDGPMTLLLEV